MSKPWSRDKSREQRLLRHLGVVMEPDLAQLSANLGRNLREGRLGVLTVVFEAA